VDLTKQASDVQSRCITSVSAFAKDGLSLKIKYLHIHLYFIATQYL